MRRLVVSVPVAPSQAREPNQANALGDLDRALARFAPLLRRRHVVVTVAAFAFGLHYLRGHQPEWEYFYDGSRLLLDSHPFNVANPGGLHFYANFPNYQIGPLSLLVAVPFRWMGYDTGRFAAMLLMTAVAPVLVFLLERTAVRVWTPMSAVEATRLHATVLLGGLLVVQSWSQLAVVYVHLDDVLAIGAAVVAMWAIAHDHETVTGAMIGVAAAAKPWGILLAPLLLALPARRRVYASVVAGVIVAATWAPFFLADTRTFAAGRPQVRVAADSVLHLFGVALGSNPAWIRPAQFGVALIAASWAVRKGYWGAVLLVVIAVRIALDPQVLLYYDSGLVLAALAWDLLRSRNPLPVWTVVTFLLLDVTHGLGVGHELQAVCNLTAAVTTVAFAVAAGGESVSAGSGRSP